MCICVYFESIFVNVHTVYSDVFTEIFNRHDLDGNSGVSRNEFDFFNERTRDTICDDETWKVVNGK